jgi:homoserine kinase type II
MKVYILQHAHSLPGGVEDVKFIRVYSSMQNARLAIFRLGEKPGFSQTPDGFHIDAYQLDTDQWIEGYSQESQPAARAAKTTTSRTGSKARP